MLPKSFPSTHTWNVGLSASSLSLGATEVPGCVAGAAETTTLNWLLRIVAPSIGSVTLMRYSLDVGAFDCFEVGSWADTAAAKANTPASTRMALVSLMTQPPFGARGADAFNATSVPKQEPRPCRMDSATGFVGVVKTVSFSFFSSESGHGQIFPDRFERYQARRRPPAQPTAHRSEGSHQ